MIDAEDLDGGRPWALASLRIATDDQSVDEVSELLGLEATSTRSAEGDPAFTVWMLESGLDPSAPIEDHLYILMERLRDRHDAVRRLAATATVEVWLSYSPGTRSTRSAVFDHQVLAELGGLGVDLVLDPYPPGRRSRPGLEQTTSG